MVNVPSPPTFLHACGLNGPFALTVLGPAEGMSRCCVLDQPFALLGRHPSNSIPLDDPQVSQRHVYIQVLAGRLFCVDLGSRTGVHRNGVAFTSGWVQPGEEVRVGPFGICCSSLPPPSAFAPPNFPTDPLVQRVSDPALLPDVAVEVVQDGVRLSRWRMNRCLAVIGHDPGARLRLRDRSVSRFHCSLVGTPDGVWVVDLLGRGGTLLNGLPVSATRINNGDCLQVGRYELRFACQGAFTRSATPVSIAPPAMPFPGRMNRGLTPLGPAPVAFGDSTGLLPLFHQLGMQQQAMMDQFQQSMLMMVQMFMRMHQDQVGVLRDEVDQLQRLTAEIHAAQAQLLGRSERPAAAPVPAAQPAAAHAPPAHQPVSLAEPAPPLATPTPVAPASKEGLDSEYHAWLSGQIAELEHQRQTVWQRVLGVMFGR
jgi:pSer/pThr/pTyr-binding forkhead associated (FHA) protein